jgi:hypothetical protein
MSSNSERPSFSSETVKGPEAAPRFHPDLAELYRQKVADLQDALADPATRSYRICEREVS